MMNDDDVDGDDDDGDDHHDDDDDDDDDGGVGDDADDVVDDEDGRGAWRHNFIPGMAAWALMTGTEQAGHRCATRPSMETRS